MADKQTALITGASSGIGLELARLFAADGHDLVLVARSADKLQALADALSEAHGVRARVEPADLSDPAAPAALADRLEVDGVQIDVLVNNAGFGSTGAFHERPVDRELAQIQVNVSALTALTGRLLPGMVARGRGRILNVASTAAFQAGPYMAVYYATKAYVLSFTEAIAYELKGTGVTATAHCPGATHTGFGAASGNADNKLFTANKNIATAEDVARDAYAAMWAGRPVAIHGLTNWIGAFSVRLAPRAVTRAIASVINRP